MHGVGFDIQARREAIALTQCPFRSADVIQAEIADIPDDSSLWSEIAARQKPEIYARFAPFAERTLTHAFKTRQSLGGIGLLAPTPDNPRQVTIQDVNTWRGLNLSWMTTLDHCVAQTVNSPPVASELLALQALWDIRQKPGGFARNVQTHLTSGVTAAIYAQSTTAYGMSKFLTGLGVHGRSIKDEQKQLFMRPSSTPVEQLADLELQQFDTYLQTFLGIQYSGPNDKTVVTIHHGAIDSNVYQLLRNGRVVFNEKPDLRETPEGTLIRDVPPAISGPRIGCPIRLTPQLTQKFWGAYIDTAHHAGLLRGNPAHHIY